MRPLRTADVVAVPGSGALGSWAVPVMEPEGAEGRAREMRALLIARRYLRQRRLRRFAFQADVFREPVWDIMLDLYCCRLSGRPATIMDACIAADVPSTTGFRHVQRLVSTGLARRRRDSVDRRRIWLELTDDATARIEAWLLATWSERTSAG